MDAKRLKIRRRQLDDIFSNFHSPTPPRGGWVKTIREALGMRGADLGSRIGLVARNVYHLERNEASGSITINTLRKAADGLNCDVVVLLIPRMPLGQMVKDQATKAAISSVARTNHSMALEDQAVGLEGVKRLVEDLSQEFIDRGDFRIWQ